MVQIARGDKRAFEVLYDRHNKALYRYFHRMLWRDEERAEDMVQDFFMKIIKNPHLFDEKRKFSTWMYSVAHNMCKNEYRSKEIRQPVSVEASGIDFATENDFEKKIDRKKFMSRLSEELEQMDEMQRTTFVLRYEENLSIREISEVLECSEGTVKSRLFYTLRKLAGKLEEFSPAEK
jgi:RNA polymerase sigma-70 factor, ECF subfamily